MPKLPAGDQPKPAPVMNDGRTSTGNPNHAPDPYGAQTPEEKDSRVNEESDVAPGESEEQNDFA